MNGVESLTGDARKIVNDIIHLSTYTEDFIYVTQRERKNLVKLLYLHIPFEERGVDLSRRRLLSVLRVRKILF